MLGNLEGAVYSEREVREREREREGSEGEEVKDSIPFHVVLGGATGRRMIWGER